MRKYFFILVATLLISTSHASTAFAGWSSQYYVDISAWGSSTVGFTPGMAGDHQIEFLNDSGIYNAGYMASYWGSNNNPGVWNWWADSDVLSYYRYQSLYSGSSDIVFRFIFHNETSSTHRFYYRFYTDN